MATFKYHPKSTIAQAREFGIAPGTRNRLGMAGDGISFDLLQSIPSDERFPFYHLVPKNHRENLEYRRAVIKWGAADKKNAECLWNMSRRDMLFYVNTFVWTYRPYHEPKYVPMNTWQFQDDFLLELDNAIEGYDNPDNIVDDDGKVVERRGYDVVIEKSREMGASWGILIVIEWKWHFQRGGSFMLASRVEDLVDKKEDYDSLFPKIDIIHKYMPGYMMPSINRTHMHLYNEETGAVIDGRATTQDLGRGGRRTCLLLDEFAMVDNSRAILSATADVSPCRIINSTPKGQNNGFYKVAHSSTKKVTLPWTSHPEKRKGLYYLDHDGKKVKAEHLEEYQIYAINHRWAYFDGHKLRSTWYDAECKRRHHPMEIAQEIDIDYLGSDAMFFDHGLLDAISQNTVLEPERMGELIHDETGSPLRFDEEGRQRRLKLWCPLDDSGRPPYDGVYVVGADISFGTGASNSAIMVYDKKRRKFVAEFADPNIDPNDLATYAVAISRFFQTKESVTFDGGLQISFRRQGAFLIWERNGPGRIFGNKISKLGYGNLYFQPKNQKSHYQDDTGKIAGWTNTRESKLMIMGEMKSSMKSGEVTIHSRELIEECRQYIYRQDGFVVHSKAQDTDDPSGAKENHGDRCIAAAVALFASKQTLNVEEEEETGAPYGTLAWRREHAESKARELDEDRFVFNW